MNPDFCPFEEESREPLEAARICTLDQLRRFAGTGYVESQEHSSTTEKPAPTGLSERGSL